MAAPIPVSDHKISLDDAIAMIRRQGDAKPDPRPPILVFYRLAFDRILGQPGCVAVRIYPAVQADGRPTVVLVGIDDKGNDMAQGELSEVSMECPPFCPDDSPLMGA